MIGLRVSKAHIDITSAAFDDTAGAVPDLNGPTFPYLVQLNLVNMFFQEMVTSFSNAGLCSQNMFGGT